MNPFSPVHPPLGVLRPIDSIGVESRIRSFFYQLLMESVYGDEGVGSVFFDYPNFYQVTRQKESVSAVFFHVESAREESGGRFQEVQRKDGDPERFSYYQDIIPLNVQMIFSGKDALDNALIFRACLFLPANQSIFTDRGMGISDISDITRESELVSETRWITYYTMSVDILFSASRTFPIPTIESADVIVRNETRDIPIIIDNTPQEEG